MKWNLFVAKRYFLSKRTSTITLSVVSIAVGVAALITVLSVMNGLQIGFIEDILALNSFHVRVEVSSEDDINQIVIDMEEHGNISSAVPALDIQTLIEVEARQSKVSAIKILAVGENIYEKDKSFSDQLYIKQGDFAVKRPRTIIIGNRLANSLGAEVGSKINLLNTISNIRTGYISYEVTGIFKSGNIEYDDSMAYIGYEANISNTKRAIDSFIGIKLNNRNSDRQTIQWLKSKFPDKEIVSWREFNKSFFSALRMEKIIIFILVGLIFILVGGNIYNALRRSVYERREEVGLLLALGAEHKSTMLIFVIEGIIIGFIGSFSGLILGLFLCNKIEGVIKVIEKFLNVILKIIEFIISPIAEMKFNPVSIFSPADFYLDKLPVNIIFTEVAFIFLFGFFTALAAAYKASREVAKIKPARIIREG